MFNFGKKEEKPKRSSGRNLSQFGLFDIPGDFDDNIPGYDDAEVNAEDLEAELAALTRGNPAVPKRKPKLVSPTNLNQMIAESLKDIPSDEEVSDGEDDPSLLSELQEISGGVVEAEPELDPVDRKPQTQDTKSLLADRLKMYETAEANAKQAGESSRARRLGRGVKTLKDMIKSANSGRPINPEDIPPEVALTITKRPEEPSTIEPTRPAPPVPEVGTSEENTTPELSAEQQSILNMLNERKKEFKLAALKAKREENSELAVKYVKIARQFDVVIAAVEAGKPVDLSTIPEPPESTTPQPIQPVEPPPDPPKEENPIQQSSAPEVVSANTVEEALQQRLEKYKSEEAKAKTDGNSSKARRMGRIVKQFEDAIKAYKAGKPVAFEELPTPPGFGPIPGVAEPEPIPIATLMKDDPEDKPKPTPTAVITSPSTPAPGTQRKSGNQSSTTSNEKQLKQLIQKQHEFKVAALTAKKNGEIIQAKEYLKMAKGLDKLIEAAKCGLPVDMATVPIPASARSQLDDEFDIVTAAECTETDDQLMDILSRLESQLTKQLKLCFETRDHLQAIGDVAGRNRFEHLALDVTKDLDYIRVLRRQSPGEETPNPPKFHYETKKFSYVKCNTDLNDDELDLEIIRGINYKCANPNEIDTYVKFEFPYPQEEPVRDRTALVKDTNNPEYKSSFKIPIQRNVRACQRMFKRHGLKLEVYSKGGFFRSDQLLGTVTVKLQELETKVEIHNSFDLMDGRKIVGGKLEVKLRLRNPLMTRQIEELSEKWLILDL